MMRMLGVSAPSPAQGRAYERLASSMREAIRVGMLAEGYRLPSEATLAKDAGVGRSTVREALRLLQESGYIERVSPKVLVVRAHAEESAVRAINHALRRRTVTFEALYESLMLLEPALSRLAALRREPDDLEELQRILDAQRKAIRNFPLWCRLDETFHVRIAEASANAPLILARATLGQIIVPTVAQFVTTETAAMKGTEFHQRLFTEIANGDGELAAVAARRHIEDFGAAWERVGLDYHRDISQLIDAATGHDR